MREEVEKEFQEWYGEQKDKIRQILNDPEFPNLEIKKILIENATDHIGLWKKDRMNGQKRFVDPQVQHPSDRNKDGNGGQTSPNPVREELKKRTIQDVVKDFNGVLTPPDEKGRVWIIGKVDDWKKLGDKTKEVGYKQVNKHNEGSREIKTHFEPDGVKA